MSDLHKTAVRYAEDLEEAYNNGELYEALDDVLDVEYTLDSSFNLIGVELTLAYGGPNIFLNTRYNRIEAYWGGEQSFVPVDSDVCNDVFEMYEDYLNSAR